MGAALAFYTLFSLAPLLVLVIAIAGLAIGHDQAQQLLLSEVSGLLGETGARGVKSLHHDVFEKIPPYWFRGPRRPPEVLRATQDAPTPRPRRSG
jgi:hypothetical protein